MSAPAKLHISAGADETGLTHTWCCRSGVECVEPAVVRACALGPGYLELRDACIAAGVTCKICTYNWARNNTREKQAEAG